MNLVARCPACGTTFRINKAQLAAKDGKVRCGKCATVFNGVSALIEAASEGMPKDETGTRQDGELAPHAPGFLRRVPAPQHRLLWGFLAALALLALVGQLLLHYRTEAASLAPAARLSLAAACDMLGCELHLPRNAELLSIESSDIQPDRARETVVVLNAVIRNRAAFAQDYPALELTLTDERDLAVLRRVLLPADYLRTPASETLAQGIAGGAEAVLRVHLDRGNRRAVGYRLYLFYP